MKAPWLQKGKHLTEKSHCSDYENGKKVSVPFEDERFYLRGSVEYTNPQLTVEEVQGIIGTRLLETCANYYYERGLRQPDDGDVVALVEMLKKPSKATSCPFFLNTDDVEADRYSMNPLKQSIVDSGQSAFPAVNVKTDGLKIDEAYVKKYDGRLISKKETELITAAFKESNGSYLDFVDSIKYTQLKELSEFFGMDLTLYALRMPLSTLKGREQRWFAALHNQREQPRLRFHRGSVHLYGAQHEKPHHASDCTAFKERLWFQACGTWQTPL